MKYVLYMGLITLLACKSIEGPKPDGGSCSYRTTNVPAEVIDILQIDSVHYNVYFVLKGNHHSDKDTITYYQQSSTWMTAQEFNKLGIKLGDVFTYEIKDITDGHCSPHLEWLKMERYK